MKTVKKLLALLLAMVMILGMLPLGTLAQENGHDHLEGCTGEDCTAEGCTCRCHYRHLDTCLEGCTGTLAEGEACECDCHFVHLKTCPADCTGTVEVDGQTQECACECHDHIEECVENCVGETKDGEACACSCHHTVESCTLDCAGEDCDCVCHQGATLNQEKPAPETKCEKCDSAEHTTENHPVDVTKCEKCDSTDHTTENHPADVTKCETCGSTEHTTENHPAEETKCETCGSAEHTTENHPKDETKCGICGGGHADADCTLCLFCKKEPCVCVVCEECGVKNDHTSTCTKRPCETCKKNPCECACETCGKFPCECPEVCEHCGVELVEGAKHKNKCMALCKCDPKPSNGGVHRDKDCPWYEPPMKSPAPRSAQNVYNETKNIWYENLSSAVMAATAGDTIAVYESFTESVTVKIAVNNLTIYAPSGKNPTISWTNTTEITTPGATSYNCVLIESGVTDTTFGKANQGTLTFDASQAADDDNIYSRARVVMHKGSGTLNINDGIVITGGCPGGRRTVSWSLTQGNPELGKHYEVIGEVGFGAGVYVYSGSLNMSGGIIRDNYSEKGLTDPPGKLNTESHNAVGGGGGVYLHYGTKMVFSGGTITGNTGDSGGGGGILVGYTAKLTMTGGEISENRTEAASGGGIGIRQCSTVVISGGLITKNYAKGNGGGVFARGGINEEAFPGHTSSLTISGGTISENKAGSYGGGVLFWTVGEEKDNFITIKGDVNITNNEAESGGGIAVGREYRYDQGWGNTAKLIIDGTPVISNNTATKFGGGIFMQSDVESTSVNTVTISGRPTIQNNSAKQGGGIYVPGGTVTMTGGTFSENTATENGAGIFTSGGTMTITNTDFAKNVATGNGGGAYVQGGSVIMNSGSFSENSANNGGAMYVTDGKDVNGTEQQGAVIMYGGEIDSNTATKNGGALYIVGKGGFTMISGSLTNNKATGDTSYGGGAYISGGNAVVGVSGCTGAETNHTMKHTDKAHPVVSGNVAKDSGGGIAMVNGNMTMYCGTVKGNSTESNRGRGENIYMEAGSSGTTGTFTYHYGTIGDGTKVNPELVIVGGKFVSKNDESNGDITLTYHHCNDTKTFTEAHSGINATKTATITKSSYFNLPDGEKYWNAPTGYRFIGWTFEGFKDENSGLPNTYVRKKEDYKPLGQELEALGTTDGTAEDGEIVMYAVWAPLKSEIQYVTTGFVVNNVFVEGTVTNHVSNPTTYDFMDKGVSNNVKFYAPSVPGYTFKGWYMYQNEGKNANWGNDYEPVYKDGSTTKTHADLDYVRMTDAQYWEADVFTGVHNEDMGDTNFGNITLIPVFEPARGYLTIHKAVEGKVDEGQTFIFDIIGKPHRVGEPDVNMTVSLEAGERVTLKDLPVGIYTITERTDWSWRYEAKGGDEKTVNVEKYGVDYLASFVNVRTDEHWLSSDSYAKNLWDGNNNVQKVS